MLWLPILAFIGSIGAGQAFQMACYHMGITSCNISPSAMCLRSTAECISHVGKACDVEKDETVKKSQSFLQELCDEGSETNKQYKKELRCLSSMGPITDCLLNVELESSNDVVEQSKSACRYSYGMFSCVEDKIEDKCGSVAENIYNKIRNSEGNELGEKLCDQINGSNKNSFNLSILVCQIAMLTLFSKAFYC